VEVRNTPPKQSVVSRDSAVLIEDLGLALRDVSVFNGHLPDGAVIIEKIDNVKAIFAELSKRSIEVEPTLGELPKITNWKMDDLLADLSCVPCTHAIRKRLGWR